jgi:hypothetical protein
MHTRFLVPEQHIQHILELPGQLQPLGVPTGGMKIQQPRDEVSVVIREALHVRRPCAVRAPQPLPLRIPEVVMHKLRSAGRICSAGAHTCGLGCEHGHKHVVL